MNKRVKQPVKPMTSGSSLGLFLRRMTLNWSLRWDATWIEIPKWKFSWISSTFILCTLGHSCQTSFICHVTIQALLSGIARHYSGKHKATGGFTGVRACICVTDMPAGLCSAANYGCHWLNAYSRERMIFWRIRARGAVFTWMLNSLIHPKMTAITINILKHWKAR